MPYNKQIIDIVKRFGDFFRNPKKTRTALSYISALETIEAAQNQGLSVCDYLERLWDQVGHTQRVIDRLASYHAFKDGSHILEIGTGTGRYLEKTLEKCKPQSYESYETAEDWNQYLKFRYPSVHSYDADGVSLLSTPDLSIDFLHSHGLFVYLPFLSAWQYFKEMWRVVKIHGIVAFDLYSENCMDEHTVEKWLASNYRYPCFLSTGYLESIFASHGFALIDTFTNPHGEGKSEYLVFRRISTDDLQ